MLSAGGMRGDEVIKRVYYILLLLALFLCQVLS
jgi:hypothetical protein